MIIAHHQQVDPVALVQQPHKSLGRISLHIGKAEGEHFINACLMKQCFAFGGSRQQRNLLALQDALRVLRKNNNSGAQAVLACRLLQTLQHVAMTSVNAVEEPYCCRVTQILI